MSLSSTGLPAVGAAAPSEQHAAVLQPAGNDAGPSLQERFEAMRKRRMEAAKRVKAAAQAGPRSAEVKAALRQKFVERVKSYIGTPYSRSRNPSDQEAPLYLDCCGLVRRALTDLKEDFGFSVGPWAQEYQFDTLPDTIGTANELVPGDLIFWAANYDDPARKPHRHDLVHVEVFIGDGDAGEGTVGSRYEGPGVVAPGVAAHTSFRSFGGHGAHGHRLLFKSIDAWLDGKCVSHCAECSWGELPKGKGSKYSMFADDGCGD